MKEKTKVAILFGGRSTEHEISLLSAQNVIQALDKDLYEPILIGIDKSGKWHYNRDSLKLMHGDDASKVALAIEQNAVLLSQNANERSLILQHSNETIATIDVIFPVLHGTYGEDGSIQGFAKLANIPCVGCNLLGSAIGMDKDIMKKLLRDANIAVARWQTQRTSEPMLDYEDVSRDLGKELFIKPANLGSSVGVSFVENAEDFNKALHHALEFDNKVIIEEKLVGREIECAVLGNDQPEASIPGEVIPKNQFYSFESKYLDESGAQLMIPAELSDEQIKLIQSVSIDTYKTLECQGMARVDVFLCQDDKIIINEINTIPGFTNISMYPKLWEISGLDQTSLITRLIELAIEAHGQQNKLRLK